MKKTGLFFFIFLFLLAGALWCLEDLKLIESQSLVGLEKGEEQAKKTALANAKKNALEKVLMDYLDDETFFKNYKKVGKILNNPDNFLKNLKIIQEQKDEKNSIYLVKINGQVDLEDVLNNLRGLGLARSWKILVLADQYQEVTPTNLTVPGGSGQIQIHKQLYFYVKPVPAAQVALAKKFNNVGFKVIQPAALDQTKRAEYTSKVVSGNALAISDLAKKTGAEIIVVAAVTTEAAALNQGYKDETAGSNFNIKSGTANLHVWAYRADSGELIAANTFRGSGSDLTNTLAVEKAIGKAAQDAGEILVKKISLLPVKNICEIHLEIEGLIPKNAQKVVGIIRDFDQVISTKVTGATQKDTTAIIKFRGTTAKLADLIENSEPLQNYHLVIKTINFSNIEVTRQD